LKNVVKKSIHPEYLLQYSFTYIFIYFLRRKIKNPCH